MSWVEHTSGQNWRVRYRRIDGTVASEGGFTSAKCARARAHEIEADQHRNTFYDRSRGRITLNTWLPRWQATLNLDEVTIENYQYLIGTHIRPRFGAWSLGDIHASDIGQWSTDLHAGHEHSTVEGVVSLLGRILGDAVETASYPPARSTTITTAANAPSASPTKCCGPQPKKSYAAPTKPNNYTTAAAPS